MNVWSQQIHGFPRPISADFQGLTRLGRSDRCTRVNTEFNSTAGSGKWAEQCKKLRRSLEQEAYNLMIFQALKPIRVTDHLHMLFVQSRMVRHAY